MYKIKSTLPIISAVLNAVIVGFSLLFTKNAVAVLPPLCTLAYRFSIAFLTMSLPILFKVIKVNYKNKNLKTLLLFSIVQPVMFFIFQAYGMKYASSSEAGIIMALTPIIIMIMSHYFLKENILTRQRFFALLSVSGVIVIYIMNGITLNKSLLGPFLIFLSVISTSAYTVMAKKLSTSFTPIELTYGMMLVGAIFFNICALIFYGETLSMKNFLIPLQNKQFLIAVLYLSLLSSIGTSFLSNYSVSKMDASIVGIFANLSTVVSIFAGVFVLNESFYVYHFIGTTMILVGVIGVNKKFHLTSAKEEDVV